MSQWSAQCLETEDNNDKLISCKNLEKELLEKKLNNPTAEKGIEPEIFYEDIKNGYKTLSLFVENPN